MSEPQPGHLRALPSDTDDSEALLTIIRSLTSMSAEVPRSALNRVLREVIYFTWEHPRLPHPLVQSKYPQQFPWSPGARRLLESAPVRPQGGYGLVFEHVIPKQILYSTLLNNAGGLNREELMVMLRQGIAIAIVTKAEDQQLQRGLNHSWDEYVDDPWLRYRNAGFKLTQYRPLALAAESAKP